MNEKMVNVNETVVLDEILVDEIIQATLLHTLALELLLMLSLSLEVIPN
jgi:hypothetical protein